MNVSDDVIPDISIHKKRPSKDKKIQTKKKIIEKLNYKNISFPIQIFRFELVSQRRDNNTDALSAERRSLHLKESISTPRKTWHWVG